MAVTASPINVSYETMKNPFASNRFCRHLTADSGSCIIIYMTNDTEAAYIAGFFDGEGSVYRNSHRAYIVRFSQKDPAVLKWIRRKLGFGRLIHTKAGYHALQVNRQADVVVLYETIGPYLQVKGGKLAEAHDDYLRRLNRRAKRTKQPWR